MRGPPAAVTPGGEGGEGGKLGVLGAVLASSSGRTALESVLVVILVFGLAGLASDRFLSNVRQIRATALTIELANLRSAVNFYAALKGNLPKNLKELLRARVILPKRGIKGDRFTLEIAGGLVESMNVDSGGYPLDPFGNRYSYDPATGMVRSTTPGYGSW